MANATLTAYKAKGALKQDDLRRRREEQQVEIRRQKREENISKRRNFIPSSGPDSDEEVTIGTWDPEVRLNLACLNRRTDGCARLERRWTNGRRLLHRPRAAARRDDQVPQAAQQGEKSAHRTRY